MKDNKIKEKFILLRGEGLSFDKIVKRINVSKPTLIEWQKEFNNEIKKIQEIRLSEILEKYDMIKEKRIERITRELDLAWKAYEKIDYKEMNKRELLMMIMRLEKRLKDEIEPLEKYKMESDDVDQGYNVVIHRKIIGEGGEIIEK
ncbi:MAG: hypothetical protein WAM24_05255 [Ignavibacteriaceae bacterium]